MNTPPSAASSRTQTVIFFILAAVSATALIFANDSPSAVLVILGIIAAVVCTAWRPEIGLYAMAFSLPVIGINITYRQFVIPAADLVALLTLTGFCLRSAWQTLFGAQREKLSWPFILPFVLFFLTAIVSALFGKHVLHGIWYSFRWILFFYLAFVWMPYNVIREEKTLKRAIFWFVISGLIVAGIGLASLFTQDWQNTFIRVRPLEMFGLFPVGDNQNLIAEFLVPAAALAIALKAWTKRQSLKRAWNTAMLALVAVALGTFSRAGWLALGFQALANAFYNRHMLFRKYFLLSLIVLLLAAPLGVYMFQLQREANVSSTQNRWLLSQIAFETFVEHPVVGSGTGSYVDLIDNNIRFKAKYGPPVDSHGVWQKIMAENGLIGLLAFAFFTASIFISLFHALNRYPRLRTLLLPIVLAASGAFIFQFFNTSYYGGKLWLPIGLALAAVHLAAEKKITYDSPRQD